MLDFSFCIPTDNLFGKATESKTGEMLKKHGAKRVLLHYGGGSVKKSGLYDRVVASLKADGIDFVELPGVQPNPRLKLVREGIALCRKEKVDFLLAVGGGSVIDSTKAIAVGFYHDGDVWDFYEGKARPERALPIGVVLTIPAAGSEGSDSSVITKEEGNWKRSLGCQLTRPTFAIYNPELTYTLPPYQTACGAADIMAHAMERYFTNTPEVGFNDALIEALLKTIVKQVPVALDNPEDYDARAEVMWASTIAHNNLLGIGRQPDWASHQIEHELSGIYDVAHGAGLAVVIPAWMSYVYRHDIMRFCRFAVEVFGVSMDYFHPERTARAGIAALKTFFRSIGLPVTLGELGIGDDRLSEMAAKTKRNNPAAGKVGFFVPLDTEDIEKIFELAK